MALVPRITSSVLWTNKLSLKHNKCLWGSLHFPDIFNIQYGNKIWLYNFVLWSHLFTIIEPDLSLFLFTSNLLHKTLSMILFLNFLEKEENARGRIHKEWVPWLCSPNEADKAASEQKESILLPSLLHKGELKPSDCPQVICDGCGRFANCLRSSSFQSSI